MPSYNYVVEIRVSLAGGKFRRGSGYLIDKCRVLTALHVVAGDVRNLSIFEVPQSIEVRSEGDLQELIGDVRDLNGARAEEEFVRNLGRDPQEGWRRAYLAWPPDANVPCADLAILSIDPQSALKFSLSAERSITGVPERGEIYRIAGYPAWRTEEVAAMQERPADKIVSLESVVVKFGARVPRRTKWDQWLHVEGVTPDDPNLWRGLSGAAVFEDKDEDAALIGVTTRALGDDRNNSGLGCLLFADLVESKHDFSSFWTVSGLRPPTVRQRDSGWPPPRSRDPRLHLYLFDRNDEQAAFATAVETDRKPEGNRPVVFVILGDIDDELPLVMERLDKKSVSKYFKGAPRRAIPTPIPWTRGSNISQVFKELAGQIGVELNPWVEADEVLAELRQASPGNTFQLTLQLEDFAADRIALFKDFIAAWAKLGVNPLPPVLYVQVVSVSDALAATMEAEFRKTQEAISQALSDWSGALTIAGPIQASLCMHADLITWQALLSRAIESDDIAQKTYDRLDSVLPRREKYRLRRVKEVLENVLKG